MGIIKKGILGGFSGKIGQVVGGTWKGINYMRSLPASVANPRTTGQVNQRNKFGAATSFFSVVLGSIVRPFWNGLKAQMSGFNDIVQSNIANFNNNGTPVYSAIQFSKGALLGMDSLTAIADESSGTLDLTWVDNSNTGNADSTDRLNVVYINQTQGYTKTETGYNGRSAGNYVINDSDLVTGDVIHVYAFFNRANNNLLASPTAQITTVTIP